MFTPLLLIAIFIVYFTLSLPRSYLKIYISFLIFFGITLLIGGFSYGEPGIGGVFFMLILLFYGGLILVCLLYRLFSEPRKTDSENNIYMTLRPSRRLMQSTFFAYGLASAYFVWQLSEKSFQGYHPAWVPHALLLLVTAAIGVICLIIYLCLNRGHFFLSGIGFFSTILLRVSLFTPSIVIALAKNIAGDSPFCLQTIKERGYQLVASGLDMSMITMRTTFGGYHAVLVVEQADETRLYNWSYSQSSFVVTSLSYVRSIHCKPKRKYLLGLPFFHGKKSNIDYIQIGDMAYSIPHEYQPRVPNDADVSTKNAIAKSRNFPENAVTVHS